MSAALPDWRVLDRATIREAIRGTSFIEDTAGRIIPTRLPEWTRAQAADQGIHRVAAHTAGIHLDLDTAAEQIRLTVDVTRYLGEAMRHDERPAIFVAVVGGREVDRSVVIDGSLIRTRPDGTARRIEGGLVTVRLRMPASPQKVRRVELWLPQNAAVELVELAVSAPATASPSVTGDPRWTHYGSSISHCVEADGPLGAWPVVSARELGWRLTDLGLAGQAMLDPFVARTIRDIPADFISLKVGINPVNGDTLRARTFTPAVHGFLDTIRDGHPTTPILLVSPISCPVHESAPGPTIPDPAGGVMAAPSPSGRPGALTLARIRELLEDVVAKRGDRALEYLDGRLLLGPNDVHHLHDKLHPDAAGYRLMGSRFAALARERRWNA
jgi:hypothetical protein